MSVCFHSGLSLSRKACIFPSTVLPKLEGVLEKKGSISRSVIFFIASLPKAQSSRSEAKMNRTVGRPGFAEIVLINLVRIEGILRCTLVSFGECKKVLALLEGQGSQY